MHIIDTTCSVTYMPNLVHFSIMANQLNDMPVGIGRFKRLEVFRASRNRITIVPDSIVDITTLKCLYLDSNRLSALPPNLHRLSRLKVLKLDGNVDMIYPPIEIISMGTEEVLRWSRNRLEANKTLKIR
jgi:Leucine-rich repeat (LRR) protein